MEEKPHKSQRYLNALRACFVRRPDDHRSALHRQPMVRPPRRSQLKFQKLDWSTKMDMQQATASGDSIINTVMDLDVSNSSIDEMETSFKSSQDAPEMRDFSRLTRTDMERYLRERFGPSEVMDCLSLTDQIEKSGSQPQIISMKHEVQLKFQIKYKKVAPEISCNICGVAISRTSHVKRHMKTHQKPKMNKSF